MIKPDDYFCSVAYACSIPSLTCSRFNVYLKEFPEKLLTRLTQAEPDKWPHALCKLVTLSDILKQLKGLIAASNHLKQAITKFKY